MHERGWHAMAGLPMPGELPAEPLRAVGMSQPPLSCCCGGAAAPTAAQSIDAGAAGGQRR